MDDKPPLFVNAELRRSGVTVLTGVTMALGRINKYLTGVITTINRDKELENVDQLRKNILSAQESLTSAQSIAGNAIAQISDRELDFKERQQITKQDNIAAMIEKISEAITALQKDALDLLNAPIEKLQLVSGRLEGIKNPGIDPGNR